jgi:hypothetical protein
LGLIPIHATATGEDIFCQLGKIFEKYQLILNILFVFSDSSAAITVSKNNYYGQTERNT